jgi:hypothetical protein
MASKGEPGQAVCLCGAGAALRDLRNTSSDGHEREAYDSAIAEIRLALGEDAFAAAWREGRSMSTQQAVAHLLKDT